MATFVMGRTGETTAAATARPAAEIAADASPAPAIPARVIGAWWRGWILWASGNREGGLR